MTLWVWLLQSKVLRTWIELGKLSNKYCAGRCSTKMLENGDCDFPLNLQDNLVFLIFNEHCLVYLSFPLSHSCGPGMWPEGFIEAPQSPCLPDEPRSDGGAWVGGAWSWVSTMETSGVELAAMVERSMTRTDHSE